MILVFLTDFGVSACFVIASGPSKVWPSQSLASEVVDQAGKNVSKKKRE